MSTAPLPDRATPPSHMRDQPRADNGYFGPESVSWQLYADPAAQLGGIAALLLQALNPAMMRLFAATSVSSVDTQARGERTGRYINTTIFGDKAHADAAAEAVRRMHHHAAWTDPQTGEVLRADTPAWLDWTHNTLIYAVLRAADAWGPELSRKDQDRFVLEQHISAQLIGIDTARLPATRAALEAYIDQQQDWMALTIPAAEASRELRSPSFKGNPLTIWTGIVINDGILSLLPPWALLLYGIAGRPMNLRAASRTTKGMLAAARRNQSYEQVITDLTTKVDAHPYRNVRPKHVPAYHHAQETDAPKGDGATE